MRKNLSQWLFKSIPVVIAGSFMISCGDHGPDQHSTQDTTETQEAVTDEVEEAETVILPSPLQIASIFKRSGLKYINGVTNPESNTSKYSSSFARTQNLGIYTADLAYCVLNKQTQPALNYIKTVKQISDQLGMSSVFESLSLVSRFEKNLGNEDSLAYLIAELQMETDMYLDENDQKQMAPVIFAGAWIESMYIGGKVTAKEKNDKLTSKLGEQMIILEKIIAVLKQNEKKDSNITGLISDLNSIRETYNSFPEVKKILEMPEDEEAPGPPKLSDEEMKKLTNQIDAIRGKIVNG